MYRHPNLHAWRSMLQHLDAGNEGQILVVFVESLQDPVSSPQDAVLRAQIARGDRSTLYV